MDTIKLIEKRRELFIQWCNSNGIRKPAPCLIVNAYNEASTYCVEHKVSKTELWLIEDTKLFNQVRIKLSENRLFRLKFTEVAKIIDKTWKIFCSFLEYAKETQPIVEAAPVIVEKAKIIMPTINVLPEWIKFDGSNFDLFERTFPAYCFVNGKTVEGKSWAAIVVEVIENEIVNHNPRCKKLYTISLMPNRAERPFFFSEKLEGQNCAKLSNGYWVNLNYSIPRLIKLLDLLFDYFEYDKQSILLYGIAKHQEVIEPAIQNVQNAQFYRNDSDTELGKKYPVLYLTVIGYLRDNYPNSFSAYELDQKLNRPCKMSTLVNILSNSSCVQCEQWKYRYIPDKTGEKVLSAIRRGDNLLEKLELLKQEFPEYIFTNWNAKDEIVERALYVYPQGMDRRGNVLFEIWHLATEGQFDLYLKRPLLTDDEYQESLETWDKTNESRGRITRHWYSYEDLIAFLKPKLCIARNLIHSTGKLLTNAQNSDFLPTDDVETGFVNWLANKGMAEATVRSYVSCISSADTYAREMGIEGVCFATCDYDLMLRSIDILLANHDFIEHNKRQHNRFSAAFRKLRDYITEVHRREDKQTSDVELEVKYPELYHKLYAVSKIYDDPNGLTIDHIMSLIGYCAEKEELVDFLDRISWASKISDDKYTFCKSVIALQRDDALDTKNIIPHDFDKEAFIHVLMVRYRNGMQFDSIDFEIFRDTYADYNDAPLNLTDEELEERLKYCGVYYMDRLFPAEGIIDSSTSERLFAYIETQFASGSKVLYYKAIFSDLADAFAYCFSLTDERMLRAYIEFMADKGKYYFFENYMSTEKNVKIDHSAEIVEFMLSAGKPLSYDDVYEGLSHISRDIIYREIRSGSNYVMNGKENYFHIDIFEFSESDGGTIAEILDREIEDNGYAIWSNVFATVQEKMAVFLENNLYLSPLGIRNALSKVMSNRFDFDGEVISAYGAKLAMADVFRLYAKHNAPFTDIDLYNFSKETDTTIYFGAVADATVRVSKTLFVSKKHVEFDVEAVDKAIATYLTSGYILVKDVDSFLVFPNVGYEWNEYLLESFLLYYSNKFTLVNNGTSLNNVAGAVALKGGEYSEFVDICAHVLANSGVELKKTIALDYLAEVNLITRRSYREIEIAIAKARQLRNRKE